MLSGIVVHRVINNDDMSIAKLVSMILCIIGLGLVLQPGFLSKALGTHKSEDESGDTLKTLAGLLRCCI